MKKKLLVSAVAIAIAAPVAQADTVNVNVYGRIRAAVEYVNGTGVTGGKNDIDQVRVVDNSSILGFKGAEDLGDGWVLNWQAEGQLEADGDSDGKLNSRNTFVAIKSDTWGTLLGGKSDTPFKQAGRFLRDTSLNDTSGELAAILNRGVGQNFYTRQASTVQYLSPKFGGFDFRLGYAPDESKSTATNKYRVSAAAGFENQFLHATLGYETRPDSVGTAPALNDANAALVTVGVKLGTKGHITAGAEQIWYDSAEQTNLFLAAKYKVTDEVTLSAQLAQAGEADGADETGATLYGVAVQYDLSKRSNFVLYATGIENGEKAKYSFNDNTIDQPVAGQSPWVLGLGFNHTF